ncbi:MAG: hypothetical protein KC736_02295 [Candidatus Moranbacteria bacterium]|nr:hypothetical protein [Candidatus Moranbacteria bacterium]
MPRDGEAAPFKNGVDYNWKAVGSMWQENHKADFAGVIPQNFSGCLIAWSDDGKWLYATSAARFGLVHVPPGTYVPGEGRATESNEHWMCTKDMMR